MNVLMVSVSIKQNVQRVRLERQELSKKSVAEDICEKLDAIGGG
jgi:hypothetical protein